MYTSISKNSLFSPHRFATISLWFDRRHLCGYDLNLTYPQDGPFPSLRPNQITNGTSVFNGSGRTRPHTLTRQAFRSALAQTSKATSGLSKREVELRAERRAWWELNMSLRANGTIDPFYQCYLLFQLIDHAVNFTKPWCELLLLLTAWSSR